MVVFLISDVDWRLWPSPVPHLLCVSGPLPATLVSEPSGGGHKEIPWCLLQDTRLSSGQKVWLLKTKTKQQNSHLKLGWYFLVHF